MEYRDSLNSGVTFPKLNHCRLMADIDNIAVPSLFDTIYGSFNGGGHTLSL